MPGIAAHHLDFRDLVFCESNKHRTLPHNLKMIFARVLDPKTMEGMYQPAAYNLHSSQLLPLANY
jgi:hypothetical protein